MSVHRHGDGWQVRWKTNGRQRARSFARKGDAETADTEIKRRKRLGHELSTLFLDGGPTTLTLAEFVKTGFRTHAAIRARKTREQYQWALDHHLTELLDEPLIHLDVPRLMVHQTYLLEHGRSAHTTRTALMVLSKILQVAVDHGHIPANAARAMTKVEADPKAEIVPLSPRELETVIHGFTGRSRAIAVLAGHLGLSPVEARSVPWQQLTGDTLMVGAAQTKRQRAHARTITVPHATAAELRRWRFESGQPAGTEPIVGPMSSSALRRWVGTDLRPLIHRLTGREDVSLYTLRHSHASALHYVATTTIPSAARRMGHTSVVHLKHYAHVIDTLEDQPKFPDLDALIRWARESAVPTQFPNAEEK